MKLIWERYGQEPCLIPCDIFSILSYVVACGPPTSIKWILVFSTFSKNISSMTLRFVGRNPTDNATVFVGGASGFGEI
ncbi:hypothetical protein STEG23_027854 [Scotinomys teguina]